MDEIKSCINCQQCKTKKDAGVFCKKGVWLTDEGKEFRYTTLLSATLAHQRLLESRHNGKMRLNSFMGNADRCQFYEGD